MADLRAGEAIAALGLEFLILTAARSGEVLGATWDEIDLSAEVWTVLASRMKAGREHRVPLSTQALAVLEKASAVRNCNHLFPGRNWDGQRSGMAFEMLVRRMKVAVTSHGFRSSFAVGRARSRLSRANWRRRRRLTPWVTPPSEPIAGATPWRSGGSSWKPRWNFWIGRLGLPTFSTSPIWQPDCTLLA